MAESEALLVDEIFPRLPIRQWVLSAPFALHFLLAGEPHVISAVLAKATGTQALYHTPHERLRSTSRAAHCAV